MKGDGFRVGSDFTVKFDAAGSPEGLPVVRSSSKSTYVSLARGSVEIRKGTLKGSLELDMDHAYWARGPLEVTVSDLDLDLDASGVEVAERLVGERRRPRLDLPRARAAVVRR